MTQNILSQFTLGPPYTGEVHWIQKQALKKLVVESELRFARLKPEDVESNLFMYHLRRLLAEGLVTKTESGYRLSAAGKRYADKLSWKTLSPRSQPKIVTMVACRNRRGEWLVYRRRRQPFRDMISFPHGKLHMGELVQAAAERELYEKAKLRGSLRHRGEVYLSVYHEDELISHALCHVFSATAVTGQPLADPEYGSCFWLGKHQEKAGEYGPGFADIRKLVSKDSRQPFFGEFTYRLKD